MMFCLVPTTYIHECVVFVFFFERYGDHRDLHVLTHSFPTRRSSDLRSMAAVDLEGVRADLMKYGWIQDARVSRRLPDTLVVDIVERTPAAIWQHNRSEEHTSELQSLMRISYAVFCLVQKNDTVRLIGSLVVA